MALSLPAAELAATFVACVLYGIYLVTLGIAGTLLTTESGRLKPRSRIHWVVVVVSIILFVNATLDLAISISMAVQAFVSYTGPGGAAHVFTEASSWRTFTKSLSVGLQSLTGDAILIYRCWYIWSKSWLVIAFPLLLWVTNIACLTRTLFLLERLEYGQVNSGNLVPWGMAFWTLTICTNSLATSLIVWCLWRVEKQNKKFRSPNLPPNQPESALNRAMRNIAESGMIYTAASILQLAAFASQGTLNYPASAVTLHSVGITFNLIIIRGATIRENTYAVSETEVRFSQSLATGIRTSGNVESQTTFGPEDKSEVLPKIHNCMTMGQANPRFSLSKSEIDCFRPRVLK
ncbi:Carboxylic ester hydrolase [Mycena venus]|uniref:Carboxylic ester hydrolase n=1 Tax=Mycena venus TaxID=2733690 RepID=A0A8H6YJW6_9AGAR|nr:Carboxylic ester hydrolase [Mycena venus]